MEGFYNKSGRPRFFYLLVFICLIVILTSGKTIAAGENDEKLPKGISTGCGSSRRHCGLYCLYATMKLSGQEVDFLKLVKPEYVGSRKGSSLVELQKAAEDYGLYTVPIGRLTSLILRNCPQSVILHVKSSTMSQTYDHYELFLGTENGKAKIFNPPDPVKLVSFAELAPRWDGNGLIVSDQPIELGVVLAPARKRFILYAAIGVVMILSTRLARRLFPQELINNQLKSLVMSSAQCGALGIAALLFGMLYHFANDEALLANANATASIQQAHLGNFIPKISEKKVHKLLDSDTIFIDARLARDFKAGHIKGAFSVPVDANDVERQKVTANIPKDSRIVMYCQSTGCKYAEIVAIKLIKNDYSNISIFRGCWAEWTTKNGKNKRL